jgi:glycosyltransferase involved in cell wall biosynthesis
MSKYPNSETDISLIIPFFNEKEMLEECFQKASSILNEANLSYEIIFVNDGSSDESRDIAIKIAQENENVYCVQLKANVGQLKSIIFGLRQSCGRVVVTFDCDLQYPPECIPEIIRKIDEEYDMVSTRRILRIDESFFDTFFSKIGNHLINRALKIQQNDFGSIKGFSRNLVNERDKNFSLETNVYAAGLKLCQNYGEIPIKQRERKFGGSKWSLFKRIETYFDIFTNYAPRPFSWLMISGFWSMLTAIVLGLGTFFYWVFWVSPIWEYFIFFTLFLFFLGLIFLSLSLIGEFSVRCYRRSNKEPEYLILEKLKNKTE